MKREMSLGQSTLLHEERIEYNKGSSDSYFYHNLLVDDSWMIRDIKQSFPFKHSFSSAEKPNAPTTKMLGMGEYTITPQQDMNLHTAGLNDCIGIAIWDAKNKMAGLYHASKMELRPNDFGDLLFKSYFLKEAKLTFSTEARIDLISTYYTEDMLKVVKYLEEAEFKINSINSLDATIVRSDTSTIVVIDKNTVDPKLYSAGVPSTEMVLQAATGELWFSVE